MIRFLTTSIVTTAAVVALLAAPASAHETKKVAKRSALAQPASYFVKRTETKRVYLGRAPYICGPSGFGRRSSCSLRSGT